MIALSLEPDFSDNGQLAYTSTAPNLVAGDADAFADVFVYDIASGTNMRLQLTHVNASFNEAYGTAMSADGRFVAFTGYENDDAGTSDGTSTRSTASSRPRLISAFAPMVPATTTPSARQ